MKRHLLATTVLLLSVTAQLSGQTREHDQTLAGLRDIALVVKYGEVNGQPEEWQTTVLQKLEERAKQQLKEAGVRIDSTDESPRAGSPKLVFNITLNRMNTEAAPVLVEASLYQRVHLWRDAARELELVTWTQRGVGAPFVTEKMLWDVFGGQVENFIKNYKEMNPGPSPAPGEKIPPRSAQLSALAQAFAGLNSTGISVSIRRDMFSDARQEALQQFLQEAAEKRLKDAGIKLVRYTNEAEQAGHANLSVWIKLSRPNVHPWAPPIGVESRFSQWVRLARDPKKHTPAVTWESHDRADFVKSSNGDLVVTDEAILEVVNRQVDEFINALKAANPPRQ